MTFNISALNFLSADFNAVNTSQAINLLKFLLLVYKQLWFCNGKLFPDLFDKDAEDDKFPVAQSNA